MPIIQQKAINIKEQESEYVLLSVNDLTVPFSDCPIYLDRGTEIVLFRHAENPLTQSDVRQLKSDGREFVYVTRKDYKEVNSMQVLASNKSIKKIASIQNQNREEFDSAFKAGISETVDYCNELGVSVADIIQDEPIIASEMFSVLRHDNDTYTHCLNVGVYSGLLAKALKINNQKSLREIVTGGLLHDVGKQKILQEVLNKPSRLNDAERQQVEQHPLAGYNILLQRGESSHGRMMMVYQHHERPNGKGYPVGIMGEEIHPWARICAIVDVFHALTSQRPYREPMSSDEACDYLVDQAGTHAAFDEEFVQCWTETITITSA